MAAQRFAQKLISENFIMIFSKSYCPYCKRAKKTLEELGQKFQAIELNERDDGAEIQKYLFQRTNQKTVPNIFIRNVHIGGCDDLLAKKSDGSLQQLLQAPH
ncbi:2055_t:CDS:2 [Acaulospora morrowiae]|uniref:2055_t:CDS:1 n=1 Tax=Acaulospora morrowiae TaxID=94023 RepID=A0A9N9GHW0_9GLOM|nr:2055_t:CDS:2 [Acaulospora morrowiae]